MSKFNPIQIYKIILKCKPITLQNDIKSKPITLQNILNKCIIYTRILNEGKLSYHIPSIRRF